MIFSALVVNGKPLLSPENVLQLNTFLRSKEGKHVWFFIDDRRPPRSLLQNNYLWGVVYEYIANDTGQDAEEIHEEMKKMFLPRFFKYDEDGVEREVEKSTTRLSTKEFKKFIEQVCAWAATEHGINIPTPRQSEKLIDSVSP